MFDVMKGWCVQKFDLFPYYVAYYVVNLMLFVVVQHDIQLKHIYFTGINEPMELWCNGRVKY